MVGGYDAVGYVADVAIFGGHAYLAEGEAGLWIIDVADPANPVWKGNCAIEDARGVTASENHVYIANGYGGLQVVDATNPGNPIRVGGYDTDGYAVKVAVSGNYAYVADGASLQVVDVSNPSDPVRVGGCAALGEVCAVAISGSHAYVAEGNAGLRVIDVSNPYDPVRVGAHDTVGFARAVAVSGNYAYVVDDGGLRVIDISIPDDPSRVGEYEIANQAVGVAVLENYAYLVSYTGGLQVIDVSNPSNPTMIFTRDTKAEAWGLAAGEHLVCVANGEYGLYLVRANCLFTPTRIVSQPLSQIGEPGHSVTFSVVADGLGSFSYQWTKDGVNIPSATDSRFTIHNAILSDVGSYQVSVSNLIDGVLSDPAFLWMPGEIVLPTVKVTSPANNSHILSTTNAGIITAQGTATDNCKLWKLFFGFNGGPLTNEVALVSTNGGRTATWELPVALTPGTNKLALKAVDYSLNESALTASTFYFDVPTPITLAITGEGTLTPLGFANWQDLLVGQSYKVTASVGKGTNSVLSNITYTALGESGCLFSNTAVLSKPTVTFIMQSNLVLTANFVTNPLVQYGGVYNGLFMEEEAIRHHSAGYVTMKVTPKFGVSGKLSLDGNAVSFSGKLSIDGKLNNLPVKREKIGKTNLWLSLDLQFAAGPDDTIIGHVGDAVAGWTAFLTADRWLWRTNEGQQATAFTNAYTMMLEGFADNAEGPAGPGTGTLSVDRLGKVKLSGTAGDGTAIKQATTVSKNGAWPLFAALYPTTNRTVLVKGIPKPVKENHGLLMGWLTFRENTNAATSNFAPLGTVDWIKTGWTNVAWADGFTNQADVAASRWLPLNAKLGDRLWNREVTNLAATVDCEDYGLFQVPNVAVTTNNALVAPKGTTNNFKIGLTPKTGLIKGTFMDSNAVPPANVIKWTGVLLQDYTNGAGSFLMGTNGGNVTVVPSPENP